ncbi:MAG: DUF3662 domain-containing protein [Acidimicrobiia bacterium]|nr:DUF3662 domain-containing protein [Acidimicrobiia bacterium]
MNLARGLEKRLENLVDGASAAVFRGRMHPVDIASKVVRQLDFLATDTPAGPQVPNRLHVMLNPADLDPTADHARLVAELEDVLVTTAYATGWRIVGPPAVDLTVDPTIPKGVLSCSGEAVRGRLPTWAQLIADDGSVALSISVNRTLIGRDLDCDIRLVNPEISRHHAVVYTQGGTPRMFDLGSSNGTYINRSRLTRSAHTLQPGDSVVLGDLPFTFRPVT